MRKITIAELSTKVGADAKPLMDELRKADAATRKTTASMDSTWDRFVKGFTKKWTVQRFGSQVAKGLGMGSGFGLVDKGADAIAGIWERAAKAAEDWANVTKAALNSTNTAINLNLNDEEKLVKVQREIGRQLKELEGWKNQKVAFNPFSTEWIEQMLAGSDLTKRADDEIRRLTESLAALGVEEQTLKKATEQFRNDRVMTLVKANSNLESQLTKYAFGAQVATGKKSEIDYATAQAKYYELAARIKELQRTANAYTDPTVQLDIQKLLEQQVNIAKTLHELDRVATQRAMQFGDQLANSFEQAIFSGERLSDVLRGLLRDIAQMAFRSAITEPLGKMMGGWLGATFSGVFGGARATGGPVTSGTPYLVGERGPELFVPSTSGRIDPNTTGGGGTFYIDARGADRTGLARLEQMIAALNGSLERRAVAATFNAQRRRFAPASAG